MELITILEADLQALLMWLNTQRATASYIADDPEVQATLLEVIDYSSSGVTAVDLISHPSSQELHGLLERALGAFDYLAYYVGRVVSYL